MKTIAVIATILCTPVCAYSQQYPEPEFTNEIYYLRKSESEVSVVRLEKDISNLDTKVKAAGFGGAESGYQITGERSAVRIASGTNLSFVISSGESSSDPGADSAMRAQGMDPGMYSGFNRFDPSNAIVLYEADVVKDVRKVYLQKSGGYFAVKNKSSKKFLFSVKKIREGYWELVIDKPLPKGEYIFTSLPMGMAGADGSTMLFAFGVDE